MRIMSFNVRVWTRDRDETSPDYWKGRLAAILRCVRDKDPDVICLQECLPRMAKAIKGLGYKSAGVSFHHLMLVRKTMRCRRHRWRVFMDWCDVDGLRIINVHSRWEGRVVNDVVDDLTRLAAGKVAIACGDFNTTAAALSQAGLGLRHVRTELGLPERDTFQNFNKKESHGEIDHFYVNRVTPREYTVITDNYGCPGRMSDHYPIMLTI